MAYNYDKLYGSTQNALGAPTQVFVDFFKKNAGHNLRVLDIGCGQGRDALFIARLCHQVTGVDLSANGIRDLTKAAHVENLRVVGIVADINNYAPEGRFDVVLFDRTLHMLDEAPRLEVLARLIEHLAPEGWVLIADERANMAGFKSILHAGGATWQVALDKGGSYFAKRRAA